MRKKNKNKKFTKEENQGLILLFVLAMLIIYLISMFFGYIKTLSIEYEYAIDGVVGKSKECYQNEDGECLCKIGNNFVGVDNYYEK